jgi:hypothetical protein
MMNNMKRGLKLFLSLLGLITCIISIGCAGVQTQPTCREWNTATITFQNSANWAQAKFCRLMTFGIDGHVINCTGPFWIKPGMTWFRVKPGYYQMTIKTKETSKTVEFDLKQCKDVLVNIRR